MDGHDRRRHVPARTRASVLLALTLASAGCSASARTSSVQSPTIPQSLAKKKVTVVSRGGEIREGEVRETASGMVVWIESSGAIDPHTIESLEHVDRDKGIIVGGLIGIGVGLSLGLVAFVRAEEGKISNPGRGLEFTERESAVLGGIVAAGLFGLVGGVIGNFMPVHRIYYLGDARVDARLSPSVRAHGGGFDLTLRF